MSFHWLLLFFFFLNLSQKRLFKLSTTSLQPLGNHSRGLCLALCSWHIMKTILRCGGKYWAITDVTATCSSEPWLQHCAVHEYFMVWCYFEWLGQVKGAEGVISNSAGGCVAALFPPQSPQCNTKKHPDPAWTDARATEAQAGCCDKSRWAPFTNPCLPILHTMSGLKSPGINLVWFNLIN